MLADVAQKVDEALFDEPVGVVDHQRARVPRVEVEEPLHLVAHALQVLADLFFRQQRALGALAGGIADEAGAAAHHDDGPVAGALQLQQQHDRHEVAELQAGRRRIEAAVRADRSLGEVGLEAGRRVVDEAPPLQFGEEVGHGSESYEGPRTLASAGTRD